MAAWSFRVEFVAGQPPQLTEVDPATPAGFYQISGYDNGPADTPSNQRSVSVVQHDANGNAIVGSSGYLGG